MEGNMNPQFQHMLQHYNLTGIFIECTAMESTGGGFYPAFLAQKGKVLGKISSDVGELAYTLLHQHTENINMAELDVQNIYVYGYVDGPRIEKLGTELVYNEPYIDALKAEKIFSQYKTIQ